LSLSWPSRASSFFLRCRALITENRQSSRLDFHRSVASPLSRNRFAPAKIYAGKNSAQKLSGPRCSLNPICPTV
jgi:hypothetical protein